MTEQTSPSLRIVDLGTEVRPEASVVVIDVIRSFTCATIALAQKAETILCVSDLEQARGLKRDNPEYVLIGEERGLKPEDFDFGNSPEEYFLANFCGKQLVQRSTNGTRGLIEAASSSKLSVASAINASATARALMNAEERNVDLVVTDPSTSEDRACAEFIAKTVNDDPTASKLDLHTAVLRGGEEHKTLWHRRRTNEELRQFNRDVKNCSQVDQYNFAIIGQALTSQIVTLSRAD